MDKLGIFHANQTSICLDSHQEIKIRLGPSNMFKPSSNFLNDRSKVALFFVALFSYLCFMFVILSVLVLAALSSPAGEELTSWLSCK